MDFGRGYPCTLNILGPIYADINLSLSAFYHPLIFPLKKSSYLYLSGRSDTQTFKNLKIVDIER